jgi:flagellar protein FlaI
MERERILIENEILDKLSGKIFLLQDLSKKHEVIFQAFLEVYNSPNHQNFIRRSSKVDLDTFFHQFLSYGVIDDFLADPNVEDIMINNLDNIFVHKTKSGMVKTDSKFENREELDLFIKKLVIFSGRKDIRKINNVELSEIKGRANIAFSPFGPQITITRAKEKPLSIIELVRSGTFTPEIAGQFWLYIEGLSVKPANLIISGGPGSGKTTLLNALFNFIPDNERLVVIEDTLELNTELEDNCSRLESDEDTTLADLVKNTLRMRPDRVIVGEVRGSEASDLMTIMNIGKYCMGTLHASTARETVLRLQNEPMNVPQVLIGLVDVIIIMRRFNDNGTIKRVIGELVETAGTAEKNVLLSVLLSYDFATNRFRESNVSSIYRDKLAQISGRSPKEVMKEVEIRTAIIKRMADKNISDFKTVTAIFRKYLTHPQSVLRDLELIR